MWYWYTFRTRRSWFILFMTRGFHIYWRRIINLAFEGRFTGRIGPWRYTIICSCHISRASVWEVRCSFRFVGSLRRTIVVVFVVVVVVIQWVSMKFILPVLLWRMLSSERICWPFIIMSFSTCWGLLLIMKKLLLTL